jgi:hypothetical protein
MAGRLFQSPTMPAVYSRLNPPRLNLKSVFILLATLVCAGAVVPPTSASAQTASTTAIVSNLNPATYGTYVLYTAHVTPASGSGTPTGSVTFIAGGVSTAVTLDNTGHATLGTRSLGVGADSVQP